MLSEAEQQRMKFIYSLRPGVEYGPRLGDEMIGYMLALVNEPGDDPRRISAFIALVNSGVTINVSLKE